MAKVKKAQQAASKGKKKKWYSIVAPAMFENKEIGESLVVEPEDLIGKQVKVNLMNITGDIKKQNISIKFVITEVKESVGHTEPVSFELSSSLIKRYVRRKRDRIDESLVYQTKDGKKVRIKPFVLTRNTTNGSQLTDIRTSMKLILNDYIKEKDYNDLFSNIIAYNLQKELRDKLNKITPMRNCEIRALLLEKETAKLSTMPKDTPKKRVTKKSKVDEEGNEEEEKKKPAPKVSKKEVKDIEDANTDN